MSGRLAIGTTINIAKQMCEGLGEAHNLGVVHRDLKPSNIMIDKEGNVRIMDFGIARSLEAKGITGAGVMIGTPEYMSPEQVEGKEVDQRSDIYSVGVILYEMVTGRVPFEGDTPFAIGVKHKSETPKDPKELNSQIPNGLCRMILKCLEKDKEKRYQSAGEVRSELTKIEEGIPTAVREVQKRKPLTSKEITVTFGLKKLFVPALVVTALLIATVIVWQLLLKKEAVPAQPSKPSIAVLPFEDLSPQKDQAYFCDGLADELLNRLTNIESLRVPARTSAFSFKGRDLEIEEIGKKLNVETLLEGTVRKAEELMKRHTDNLEAYKLYLQGQYFLSMRTEENIKKAIKYFEQAIEEDSNYALAFVGIAESYIALPYYSSFPSKEALEKSKEASLRAIEIDNTLTDAHVALAKVKTEYDQDWAAAEIEYKQAIDINPAHTKAHYSYALHLMFEGRFDESIEEMKKALELDPLSLVINRNLGELFYYARKYDIAIETLNKTRELNPNFIETHAYLGLVYLQKMMYEEALAELQKETELSKGQHPIYYSWIGIVYALMGEIEKAKKVADDLLKRSKKEYIPPSFGFLYFALGEIDQGFEWMEKAYEEHDQWLLWQIRDPICDSVRSDPRFVSILKKLGLER